jgi:Holliday junction resolvase RusA-like endonuclease
MARYQIIVQGQFPSLNEFIDANRRGRGKTNRGNAMKKESQNIISMYILNHMRKVHIDKPIYLKYRFYERSKRRDLDNISGYFHKVFQDALVRCGTIHNDNWHYIVGFSDEFYIDNKNPRIEIEIIETEK